MSTQAEVRHVTSVNEENRASYLKVGIQFRVRSKRFLKGYISDEEQKKALPQDKMVYNETSVKQVTDQTLPESENQISLVELAHLLTWESKRIDYKNNRHEEIAAVLDWTAAKGQRVPVVIVSPAYGKKKESTSLLASMILQNFILRGKAVAIVRYDGIRSVGDSFKDISCRESGQHNLNMTLSQGVKDLKTTIDFCYHNEWFVPEKVILCSPSLSAVVARRTILEDKEGLIHAWICPMGATDPRTALTNASGGIDYLDIIQQGRKVGVASILGINVDWDNFWKDAMQNNMATFEQALEEMQQINVPVGWIAGIFDAWVPSDSIKTLINNCKGPQTTIYEVPTGHLPLNGKEAINLF